MVVWTSLDLALCEAVDDTILDTVHGCNNNTRSYMRSFLDSIRSEVLHGVYQQHCILEVKLNLITDTGSYIPFAHGSVRNTEPGHVKE